MKSLSFFAVDLNFKFVGIDGPVFLLLLMDFLVLRLLLEVAKQVEIAKNITRKNIHCVRLAMM